MATTFKTFMNNDVVSTRTLLHEAIPITGTLISGTYGAFGSETNVRDFSHGMFQSVYDYPFLSSSANHIFDITIGYHTSSGLNQTAATTKQNSKKLNIYNQMAQVLVGYDATGSIMQFDKDGDFTAGSKLNECYFISLSRLLVKDEIKKGSFSLELGVEPTFSNNLTFSDRVTLKDTGAENDYRVNSPAGEYAILYIADAAGDGVHPQANTSLELSAGLIYYQAGVLVITASVFNVHTDANGDGTVTGFLEHATNVKMDSGDLEVSSIFSGTIEQNADALRHRIYNMSFNNTTELNSTVYFCRASHNEFNYSSNPTYLTGSKIFVKENSLDTPVSYLTTIGLYGADSELLAVAKLSEPLKKDPNTELTLRVRLDY